jgi:hypothetical protein
MVDGNRVSEIVNIEARTKERKSDRCYECLTTIPR